MGTSTLRQYNFLCENKKLNCKVRTKIIVRGFALAQKKQEQTIESAPSHYVGIGASAGGLEAIEKFIINMPVQNQLAFIIVQHLSPDYKSLMVELLAKKTEIPVHRAEEGMEVRAGNIYLIPPKKNLTIFHGKLLLKDKSPDEGISLPIDIFFQSLAEDQEERAIGIILSGTGSDGARGVRSIKENNGMVMVQEESSAKFDGMPKAAISTGAADYILPPEKMPEQILSYVAHPYISGEKRSDTLLEDGDSLTRLFAELRSKTKADFTHYKPSTISRRIERRMTVNQINDFDEYVRYLANFPGEVMALYRELLIGVTSFFRDEDAMEAMQKTISSTLFKKKKLREIRCWVAGCSTGEEAYTLAIIFKELMEQHKVSLDIKIFATDIDREAIIKASTGTYPESIAADLPARLLAKYFYHKEDSFQIIRVIREMVVFAQHNLINDPPFTNIDIISCRNLLIYLQPVLQTRALAMFNFSLKTDGILFLGSSETVGEMADFFKPMQQRYRIYQSCGKKNPLPDNLQVTAKHKQYEKGVQQQMFGVRRQESRVSDRESIMIKSFLDQASRDYLPLSVIVDEHLDIQQIIGDTTGFFTIPSGPIEYNISKFANRALAIPLATGIQKVFRTGEEVSYSNIHFESGDQQTSVRLSIRPLPQQKGQSNLAVVFLEKIGAFSPQRAEKDAAIYDAGAEAQQRIEDLEQELQFARENLQATIEELETSNEELQATNEELLASNEELQSTNEELQSTNEELYTVNAEHQNKIIELTELTNDVDNLMTSSRIGTLIVDENLEIRKFSPEISNIFNILEKDIGRPFTHISHHLTDFDPVAAVKKIQKSNDPIEKDVQTRDGKSYLARILPYHIGPQIYSGVVLTFVDISELIRVKHNLVQNQQTDRQIKDNIPAGLLIFQQENGRRLRLVESNSEAEKLTGLNTNENHDKSLEDIWPQVAKDNCIQELIEAREIGRTCIIDNIEFTGDHMQAIFHIHAFRLPDNKLAISFEDQSQRINYENHLKKSGKRLETLLKSTDLPWWEWKIPENEIVLSETFAKMTGNGQGSKIIDKKTWSQLIHPDDLANVDKARKQYVSETADNYYLAYRLRMSDGSYSEVVEQGEISEWNQQSEATRFIGMVASDV